MATHFPPLSKVRFAQLHHMATMCAKFHFFKCLKSVVFVSVFVFVSTLVFMPVVFMPVVHASFLLFTALFRIVQSLSHS